MNKRRVKTRFLILKNPFLHLHVCLKMGNSAMRLHAINGYMMFRCTIQHNTTAVVHRSPFTYGADVPSLATRFWISDFLKILQFA